MALTATLYSLEIELADVDRGVYESLALRVAQQPSETAEYMVTRVLAYCLEHTEGIAFTEGVAAGDEPAVWVLGLDGRIEAWIEVGLPGAARLHRGRKLANRVAVYTHRNVATLQRQLEGEKIHAAETIPIFTFKPGFVEEVARHLDRRTKISLSVTERELYLDLGGHHLTSRLEEHHLS